MSSTRLAAEKLISNAILNGVCCRGHFAYLTHTSFTGCTQTLRKLAKDEIFPFYKMLKFYMRKDANQIGRRLFIIEESENEFFSDEEAYDSNLNDTLKSTIKV